MNMSVKNPTVLFNNILKYEMSVKESTVYKCAAIYQHIIQKMFPKLRMIDIHTGDPRKKELFKYCWKMVNEIEGVVKEEDYRAFIYAQLIIFKAYMNQDQPPYIHPNCLTGQRALNRWFYFKSKLEKRKQYETLKDAKIEINTSDRVVQELLKTKEFLTARAINADKLVEHLNDGSLQRWVALKQVCPYYVLLSTVVKTWLVNNKKEISDVFGLGINVYKSGITDNSKAFFEKEFS